jgi:hypothetical protein
MENNSEEYPTVTNVGVENSDSIDNQANIIVQDIWKIPTSSTVVQSLILRKSKDSNGTIEAL